MTGTGTQTQTQTQTQTWTTGVTTIALLVLRTGELKMQSSENLSNNLELHTPMFSHCIMGEHGGTRRLVNMSLQDSRQLAVSLFVLEPNGRFFIFSPF